MTVHQSMAIRPVFVSYERVPIRSYSSHGTPYLQWVPIGMPKLGQYAPILKCVFFLYPDDEAARTGVKAGGTGFLLGVRAKNFPDLVHVHAVTNYHVAVYNTLAPPSPVIRINLKSGGSDRINFGPDQWVWKPGAPDIAISPPFSLNPEKHDFMVFEENWLMSEQNEIEHEIGPGDDVFMLGRFVDYDGVETNAPAARFGHISMMAADVKQSTGYAGRSIILDMHSRSGFSGSPVFVYRTLGSHFIDLKPGELVTGGGHYIKLLGIHYAQFPEMWDLKERKKSPAEPGIAEVTLKADTHYIEGLSGMTCVVPAASILDLLNHKDLVQMREQREKDLNNTTGHISMGPKAESVGGALQASQETSHHRERFTSLLNAAAQKQKLDD